mmetsp:Transcript_55326/g.98480  ORF Transcript_55326/g.98480 Transcript_55326/m.98480 type:complete len:540 (-) Transcript_55326:2837-4456(-)
MDETSIPLSRFTNPDSIEQYGLACPVCLQVPVKPRIARCEHVCCHSCIMLWLTKSATCPVCMHPISQADLNPLGLIARRVYNNLEIRCSGAERGCSHVTCLADLPTHESSCPHATVVCPNEGCGEICPRESLHEHQTSCTCPPRKEQQRRPKGSSGSGSLSSPTATATSSPALSSPGGSTLRSSPSPSPPPVLPTSSPSVRPTTPPARRRDGHSGHSRWQIESDGWSIWILGRMKGHLADAAAAAKEGKFVHIQSPPQYTWPNGYSFVVRIYLNGDAEDINHCSVYFRFVEGENDSQIPWPFNDKACIKLINAPVQKNMDARICTKQQAETYLGRPPRSSGTGWGKFCTRDTLLNAITGDTLLLGVKFSPHHDSPCYHDASRRFSPVSPTPPALVASAQAKSAQSMRQEDGPLGPKDMPQYKGPSMGAVPVSSVLGSPVSDAASGRPGSPRYGSVTGYGSARPAHKPATTYGQNSSVYSAPSYSNMPGSSVNILNRKSLVPVFAPSTSPRGVGGNSPLRSISPVMRSPTTSKYTGHRTY